MAVRNEWIYLNRSIIQHAERRLHTRRTDSIASRDLANRSYYFFLPRCFISSMHGRTVRSFYANLCGRCLPGRKVEQWVELAGIAAPEHPLFDFQSLSLLRELFSQAKPGVRFLAYVSACNWEAAVKGLPSARGVGRGLRGKRDVPDVLGTALGCARR